MESVLMEILQNYTCFEDYDSDYNKKISNNCYGGCETKVQQFELTKLYEYLLKNGHINVINSIVSKMNHRHLYNSYLHGFMHNERVVFFGYLISIFKHLNEEDFEIVMDACKYHDIGRHNDNVDDIHGLIAANKVENIVGKKDIYSKGENLNLLKCAIDFHSAIDESIEVILDNHGINDKQRAVKICNILKDADALDRVRITMGKNTSSLDVKYLREKESIFLIKIAHQLNEIYCHYLRLKNNNHCYNNLINKYGKNLYLHGVGYDFLKLESILQNGILSKNMIREKGISSAKNYEGYNYEDYICVTSYGDQYYSNNTSFDEHIKDKICFCMTDLDIIEGATASNYNVHNFDPKKLSIPIDRGVFSDERFVRDEIPMSKVKEIIIPKNILNVKISDLSYMNNGFCLNIIIDKTNYYIRAIENSLGETIDHTLFQECIDNLKKNDTDCRNTDDKDINKYVKYVNSQLEIISKNIGILLENMYQKKIGIKNITVFDVVNNIMESNNMEISTEDVAYISFKSKQYSKCSI